VAEGKVWQNLTLERYRAAVPIAIQPVVIRQDNDLGDGLMRVGGAPDLGIEKHYGYAFQWFALAVAILIYYLATHVRKRTQQAR
jgi:surfeit locus 1 family protein